MAKIDEYRDDKYPLARAGYELFKTGNDLVTKWKSREWLLTADDLVHYVEAYCYYSILRYKQYKQLPSGLAVGQLQAADKFLRKLLRESPNSEEPSIIWESLVPWQQTLICLLQEREQELGMATTHLLEETGQAMASSDNNLFLVDLGAYHNAIETKVTPLAYDLRDELSAVNCLRELVRVLGAES